jgi:hypothetical protein
MSSVPGREPEPPKQPSGIARLVQQLDNKDVVESPRWLVRLRQLAIFLLGVWLITYSVTATSKNIAYIITGLILIGIIPVETLLLAASKQMSKPERK